MNFGQVEYVAAELSEYILGGMWFCSLCAGWIKKYVIICYMAAP